MLPLLAERGFDVHVVSVSHSELPDGAAELHRADLLEPGATASVIGAVRPSYLVHLAWDVRSPAYLRSAGNLRWAEASLRLMREFAEAGGKRAVFAGTCFEYDPTHGVCSEAVTPLRPSSLYGQCKAALESMTLAAAAELSVSVAWGRVFFAYGPGEHELRLVPSVIRRLLAGEPAPVSHGGQVRDYIYAADVGSAFATLVDSGVEGPLNIGSGEPVTLRTIVEAIGRSLERGDLIRFGEIESPPDEPPKIVADVQRLTVEVGWQASIPLAEGLERCIEWWRSQQAVGGRDR
jgi:nucleoside-diphosphate-sugar epimerase